MRDEMDARLWVEHHEAFSHSLTNLFADIGRLFAPIGPALRKLHQVQFDAPWRREAAPGPGRA